MVAALLISQEALNLHRKARQLQETAMLARQAMEETQPLAAAAEEYVVNGHAYRLERQTLAFGRGYDKQVVNLYEEGRLVYTLCRLAETKEETPA